MKQKLPKQFYHWCSRLRLHQGSKRYTKKQKIPYLKGRNRRWRVNCFFDFQMSCVEEDFDRWANSYVAEFSMTGIKTFKEFKMHVLQLLETKIVED